MKSKKKISGMYWHCHHDVICEWIYDYQKRVDYIKKEKPKSEQKIRLRLFKSVKNPEELPEEYINAGEEYIKIGEKYIKAREELIKARKEYIKIGEKWNKSREELFKDHKKYLPQLEELHKKECGCSQWNGEEIVFKEDLK